MLGTTHQMFALLTAFWILTLYPVSVGPVVATLSIIAVMVGALTPDLDQPTANIWRRVLGGKAIGNIFQKFSGGHRHMTHSLLGILVIGFISHWARLNLLHPAYATPAYIIWIAFMIGYISHPITDSLTDMGVPWLWPFNIKLKIPPGPEELRVTTGSWVELFLTRGAIMLAGVLLLAGHFVTLTQFFAAP